jgi:hypothetical protein
MQQHRQRVRRHIRKGGDEVKRIEISVKKAGAEDSTAWLEVLNVPKDRDPETYGAEVIQYFNDTLRSGESARELVASRMLPDVEAKHDWEKQNLYTVRDRTGQYYDVHKCRACGVTGKRYGLADHITRDRAYAAKKYDVCKAVR